MRVLSDKTRSTLSAVLALSAIAHGAAFAGEGAGHSPFGTLEREGFAVNRSGTAEHEALLTRPVETTTDASDVALQPSTLPDEVVFAGSALPAGQEVVAATPPPLLISSQVDAVFFGPPLAGADPGPMPEQYAGTPLTSKTTSGSMFLPAPPPEAVARLKTRAHELLANGSVASARAFLEGVAAEGDAEGEYLLAQTYDPAVLSRTGVIGIAGDIGKAKALYRAAQLGGYTGPDNNVSAAQQ